MDYSTFKSLQILLFWGSAIAFCIWQLRAVQRMRRQRLTVKHDEALRRGSPTQPRERR
ncbi:MAG: hypothetical protein GVY09_07765 [Gammaproteobacteria bacterium]|jgi:hypothetical protein|nr:hypothetical protein [Gammaproteobacteria bacterium]